MRKGTIDILTFGGFIFVFSIILYFSIITYQYFFSATNGTIFTGTASNILVKYETNVIIMDYMVLFLTIGLLACLFISGYWINSHPIFLGITILIAVFDVFIGVTLTNTWMTIAEQYPDASTLIPITNYISSMFPLVMTIGVVLFGLGIYSKPANQGITGGGYV